MIRKSLTLLRPLSRQLRTKYIHWAQPRTLIRNNLAYFGEQNDKNKGQHQRPQKTEHHQEVKNQSDKELNKQEKQPIKLSQMSVQDLIERNSQEALQVIEKRIEKMQKQKNKNENIIKQFQQKLKYLEQHQKDLTNKQEILLENIKNQQQQLKLIHKRSEKEIQDSKDYAITKLAKQLIETADNIKRCKQYAEEKAKEDPNDEYLQKIILSHKQIADLLKLYDIEEFDPTGEPFDPNTSESLVTIPCPPGYKVNNVAMAMQTGYRIKSRLLRSARVGIFV